MAEENFEILYPLDASWMTDFDDIHLYHDWRKLWNSLPLDVRRMTDIDILNLHHGWRKFCNSVPLDASRMTNFDNIPYT